MSIIFSQNIVRQPRQRTVIFLCDIDLIRLCKACDHHQRLKGVVVIRHRTRTAFLFVGQLSVLVNLMSRNAVLFERPVKQILTI
ncbi:hypothetical protein D3C80_1655260 [compost metagenome]